MKTIKCFCMAIFVVSFLCVSFAYSGEPYASLHKFTEKDFNRAYGNMGLSTKDAEMAGMWPPVKAEDVPDKEAIVASAYPGAVIVAINKPFMRDDQGKLMGLSTIELLSSDPYETIVSYYKEKLPGWNEKSFQFSHYFAQSGEVENGARNMNVPHVGVKSLEGIHGTEKYTGMEPHAKTIIEVFFQGR